MHYYWMSFSRIVNERGTGNIGAVLLTTETPMTPEEMIAEAADRGLVPEGTQSIVGAEMDEETSAPFPQNEYMSLEYLLNRGDVTQIFDSAQICSDCAEHLNGGMVH